MRFLPPQRLRPHYFEGVEQALGGYFRDTLFAPLELLLSEVTTQAAGIFTNAAPVPSREVVRALRVGTIQYHDGLITGDFDAKLSAALRGIGATFDVRANGFLLSPAIAPGWFKAEATGTQLRAKEVHEKILRELDAMRARLEGGQMRLFIDAARPIEAIEQGFKTASESLGLNLHIPEGQRAAIEKAYAENIRPYVAEATSQYIDMVHRDVTANAAAGFRYENIVHDIQHIQGVSERKARFIARQETGLFMANYRRERFTAAGVKRYIWRDSHDIRVRPYADEKKLKKYGDHRILNGQIFFYEIKAPAQYMSSKKPCNPGEDFGCRCNDRAMIE